MRLKKRIVSLMLAASLLASQAALAAGESGDVTNNPGYRVDVQVSGSDATAKVYVERVVAYGGRLALEFDNSKVSIANANSLADALHPTTLAVPTLDGGLSLGESISQSKGHVMFGWYPKGGNVQAKDTPQLIAEIGFKLNSGVVESDFDGATFAPKIIAQDDYESWDTPAKLSSLELDYKYNVDSAPECLYKINYEGDDKIPNGASKGKIKVTNSSGTPISGARVTVSGKVLSTNDDGAVEVALKPGEYSLQVAKQNYETFTENITVSGEFTREVKLLSDTELVIAVAKETQIIFRAPDTADRVTRQLFLPRMGRSGVKITWATSDGRTINSSGGVSTVKEPTPVTMTATLTKNAATTTRAFALIVIPAEAEKPVPPVELPPPIVDENGKPVKPIEPDVVFSDMKSASWALEAVSALTKLGVINGVSETEFAPQANIKRCDFISMLMRMTKPEVKTAADFADVSADKYYYKEVMQAKGLGVALGDNSGSFRPEEFITRQDMMVLTQRTLLATGALKEQASKGLDAFSDSKSVASYAAAAVDQLVAEGIIHGSDGKINPYSNTTRAESAVMLYNVLNHGA